MRHAIIGDLHLGVRSDSQVYRTIAIDYVQKFLIPTLKKENIEVLDILGDFYDNRSHLSLITQNLGMLLVQQILDDLPELQIRMIVGNHDIYYRTNRQVHSLKKFTYFDRVKVIDEITYINEDQRALVYVPWLVDKKTEFIENELPSADICFGHFEINGFEMIKGYPETKGYNHQRFTQFMRTFSGHFHIRNDAGKIVYTGNVFQQDWNDAGDDKGLYVLDTKTMATKFIQNRVSPVYMKVYLSQLKKKLVEFKDMEGNFVKLFLDDAYTDAMVDKLKDVCLAKKPLSFTIEGFGVEDIKSTEVVDSIENPIESLLSWLKGIEFTKVDKTLLLQKVRELYGKVAK